MSNESLFCAAVGKAFAIATALVFGGASLVFGLAASKLELRNVSLPSLIILFELLVFKQIGFISLDRSFLSFFSV